MKAQLAREITENAKVAASLLDENVLSGLRQIVDDAIVKAANKGLNRTRITREQLWPYSLAYVDAVCEQLRRDDFGHIRRHDLQGRPRNIEITW